MLGKERALAICHEALNLSAADQTEVCLQINDIHLSRYANNSIHQNILEANISLRVKAVIGQKIGMASTNQLDSAAIAATVARAYEIARLQAPNPEFKSLPAPQPISAVPSFYEATASITPEAKALAVGVITDLAAQNGLWAAGAYSTSVGETAIVNSLGLAAYQPVTSASLTAVLMGDGCSGYAARTSRDINKIDPAAVAEEAVNTCLLNRNQLSLEPGKYTVILKSYAAAEMLSYLGRLGFSAMNYQDGQSFVSGKLGEQVLGPNITIWDDATNPAGMPTAFDAEGVPKQRLLLVENGIARAVAYDTISAGKEPGKVSTGHAPRGMTNNLFLAPGNSSLTEMITSTERGLLVTRFHYVRTMSPLPVLITGMTRDGLFLIEDGEIKGAVKNLRFNQSVVEALNKVRMIGNTPSTHGAATCPPLKIEGFTFTGQATH
ncbi:MAG: TldD/PmbA family protein [Firmicutes bacterium]|nr:TldD/PmbA family protein [Bacillota bacterium]